jgi:CRP/FNR family transcriptional regulator
VFTKTKICHSCEECSHKSDLFRLLNDSETSQINEDRFEVSFKPGENIVKQGTILTHVVNLVKGSAKIYIEGFNNRNLLLSIAGQQTLLGGSGMYTDNRHHYTVTALEDAVVCFINIDRFKQVLQSNTKFNEAFIANLNLKRIDTFVKILSLTQKQMHGRMADAILYMSEKVYHNLVFEMPLNRQDIADLTAMSKDSAIRVLKEFERDKIISMTGKRFEVLNLPALRELSDFG